MPSPDQTTMALECRGGGGRVEDIDVRPSPLATEIVEVGRGTHAAPVMTATAPRWITALLVGFSGSTMEVVLNMVLGETRGLRCKGTS